MASRAALSSDPDFLLDLMHDLPDESDSDDDFDGYLGPEDGPVAYRSAAEIDDEAYRLRSQSLQDLTDLEEASEEELTFQAESPLSPSLSPMQGQHASSSPLAGGSPTQPCTAGSAAASSSSTLSYQVKIR